MIVDRVDRLRLPITGRRAVDLDVAGLLVLRHLADQLNVEQVVAIGRAGHLDGVGELEIRATARMLLLKPIGIP